MKRFILKYISCIVLTAFVFGCLIGPSSVHAASNTGTLKIFSEVKGIELFIDEQPQGQDKAEINDVQVGSHYVKAVKDGVTIYSELITVAEGVTTTILIKDSGQVKEKVLQSKYKEQQEYKSKKIDILLSKGMQTVGSSYTNSTYFPGYYSLFGSGWTTSSSTAYETTDWKIIQGGVQEISDVQFATLVNDSAALKSNNDAWDSYNSNVLVFGLIGVGGILLTAAGLASAGDSGIAVAAVGIAAAAIGCGVCLSAKEPSGHLITPSDAAKKAYDYNQSLKKQLGLPEDYEPQ
jgi:hypothetical protein